MYSHCIFCRQALGRNEVVESFPVGRRLAFDAARGRLWVVCPRCERWNLSPLEERWEAVEECERHFRSTRLRVATDNIGLARLSEGLELVRIGRPERPEFAAWRYGDRFGRRRRRRVLQAGLGLGAVGIVAAGGWAWGISAFGLWYMLLKETRNALRGDPDKVVAHLALDREPDLKLKRRDLPNVFLLPSESGEPWQLAVPGKSEEHCLSGERALHAVGLLLPHMNSYGGSARRVREAVGYLAGLRHPTDAFARVAASMQKHRAATYPEHEWMRADIRFPSFRIVDQPAAVRLALEMAAHEETERRAMEGELAFLEQAWREAERIAAIADTLGLADRIERGLQRLRRKASKEEGGREADD
ncbi:MAG TPA: hypothetical protein VF615_26765 [Longimicrobiaceae bacterium]|jgi:hypothetical protein